MPRAQEPTGLNCLEILAWSMGRADAGANLRPFARSRDWRYKFVRLYRQSYAAQKRLVRQSRLPVPPPNPAASAVK